MPEGVTVGNVTTIATGERQILDFCWEQPAALLSVATRYDTRCYFNVRSKADMSRLNLPHGTDN